MSEANQGLTYGPRECGSCRLWRPILEDERGPVGPCRLGVRTGDFPGTAPICERYLSRDAAVPTAPPPEPSRRRAARPSAPVIRRGDEPGESRAQGQADEPAPERTAEEVGSAHRRGEGEARAIDAGALSREDAPGGARVWFDLPAGGRAVLRAYDHFAPLPFLPFP